MAAARIPEARNALEIVGEVKLIYLTGHFRLSVPFVLGQVYNIVEATPTGATGAGLPAGLALRMPTNTAHHGWVSTASRDRTMSAPRIRDAMRTYDGDDHIVRVKITRVSGLFETFDRDGKRQVGVNGWATCWIDSDQDEESDD